MRERETEFVVGNAYAECSYAARNACLNILALFEDKGQGAGPKRFRKKLCRRINDGECFCRREIFDYRVYRFPLVADFYALYLRDGCVGKRVGAETVQRVCRIEHNAARA